MSRRRVPPPATLLLSVIYRDEGAFEAAARRLAERIGPAGRIAGPFPFDFTDYYRREMGGPLVRRFIVGAATVARDALPGIKASAEAVEAELAAGGRRTVNIDPGLLTEENVVLATGKNYAHRVYLRDGVFADLALVFRDGAYRPLPWTYPDYASEPVRSFLEEVRDGRRGLRRRRTEAVPCGGAPHEHPLESA